MDNDILKSHIHKAKSGDKESFAILYQNYYGPLYRYILSIAKDRDLALDISSETFLKWYQSLNNYELDVSPLSYLYVISKRLLYNHIKKKKSDYLPEFADEIIASEEDIEMTTYFKQETQKILLLLDEMSENDREVITLKYISELNNKEISEITGLKEDNIRQIESRALKKLREKYARN